MNFFQSNGLIIFGYLFLFDRLKMKAPAYLRNTNTTYRFITKDNTVTQAMSILPSDSRYSYSTEYEYDDDDDDDYYSYIRRYGSQQTARWPSASDLGFNESQFEAFKSALTQEYALIQGNDFSKQILAFSMQKNHSCLVL